MMLAAICDPGNCTVGDGIAVVGIAIAVAAIALALAWAYHSYRNTHKKWDA